MGKIMFKQFCAVILLYYPIGQLCFKWNGDQFICGGNNEMAEDLDLGVYKQTFGKYF